MKTLIEKYETNEITLDEYFEEMSKLEANKRGDNKWHTQEVDLRSIKN